MDEEARQAAVILPSPLGEENVVMSWIGELSRGRFYKEDCNLSSIATARVRATLQ